MLCTAFKHTLMAELWYIKSEPDIIRTCLQDGAQMTLMNYTRPETCELPNQFIRTGTENV
jgi:hypothetical protein